MNPLILGAIAGAGYLYMKISEKQKSEETKNAISDDAKNTAQATQSASPKNAPAKPQNTGIPFKQPNYPLNAYAAANPINVLSPDDAKRIQSGFGLSLEDLLNNDPKPNIANVAYAIIENKGWENAKSVSMTEQEFDEILTALGMQDKKSEIFLSIANMAPLKMIDGRDDFSFPNEFGLRLNNGGLAIANFVDWNKLQPTITEANKSNTLTKMPKEELFTNNLGIFAPIASKVGSKGRLDKDTKLIVYNTPKGNLLVNLDENGTRNILQVV